MADIFSTQSSNSGRTTAGELRRQSLFYRTGSLVLFGAFIMQAVAAILLGTTIGNDAAMVLFIASTSMLVMIAPFLLGLMPFDLFSPLSLMLGTLLMGTGWRIPFILANYEDIARARFLMYNLTFEQISGQAIWFLLAVIALVLGYLSTRKRLAFERAPFWYDFRINWGRLMLFGIIFGGIAAVFGVIFLSAGGIDLSGGDLLGSSQKIHVSGQEDVGLIAGMSRFFTSWATYPFVIIGGMAAVGLVSLNLPTIGLLLLLAIPVFAVPFLSSSRSIIVITVMSIIIIMYYYGRVKPMKFAIVLLVTFSLVAFMGSLRAENKGVTVEDAGIVQSVVGSGNGVDMMRTLGVFLLVPERTNYKYGSTYATLFSFPIPRAIWPNKPEVGLGPFVKSEILGGREVDKNGWPSGIIGEAHLNFGHYGMLVVMFLYGALQRIVYNSFRPFLGQNFIITVLYASVIWRFSFSTTMLNFAHGITGLILIALPLVAFMALIRLYPRRK